MTQQEKLQVLCQWLDEINIKWHKPRTAHAYPDGIGIIVSKPHIHVIVCPPEKEDGNYAVTVKRHTKAFFIRQNETKEYIIHKMTSSLRGWTSARALREEAKAFERQHREEEETAQAKPKRKRIHFQRVSK